MPEHKLRRKQFSTFNKLSKNWQALIVVAAFLLIGGVYALIVSLAASTASLSLTPATSSPSLGSTFTVSIHENSGTTNIDAVEADLMYPTAKLQFVSAACNSTNFDLQAQHTGGNGNVSLACGASTALQGDNVVGTVVFQTIGVGNANVNFINSSELIESTNFTDLGPTFNNGSYAVTDMTKPTTPTGLTKTGSTATSISLSWTASTDNVGVTGYNIYRNGSTTPVGTSSTTSFTDNGLTPNTSYLYTVAAFDAAGNVSTPTASSSFSTSTDTSPPTAPSGLSLGTRTMTSITINWTASTDNVGVVGYKIYRNGNPTPVGTSNSTTFTDSGLTPGTSYGYTVSAYDAVPNNSAQSSSSSFSTLPDTSSPTVPTGLNSPSQGATTVNLSWTASTDNVGVTGYNIYRNGGTTPIGTSTTTTYSDTGLSTSTSYTYTVAAYDAAGNVSGKSNSISASTSFKPGDINGDGFVDTTDLQIMANNWLKSGMTRSQGDLSGDGTVNAADLGILAHYWGT